MPTGHSLSVVSGTKRAHQYDRECPCRAEMVEPPADLDPFLAALMRSIGSKGETFRWVREAAFTSNTRDE